MRLLDVYLHEYLIGQLKQDDHGQMLFNYNESWLNSKDSVVLSCSLPLRSEKFKRNDCRGFFAGILPEESKREIIAGNLGISAKNDFAMLEQIGGECAGAITFIPSGTALPSASQNTYRPLTQKELAGILRDLPHKPLLAGEDGVRLSLAGAQDKIALYIEGNQTYLPLGNAPSSHILKPDHPRFRGLVFNEAFCMKLAKQIGLSVANVEIRKVDDVEYLMVERFDRLHVQSGTEIKHSRIHQEDFCQALGIVSEMKYQNEGGPSLKDCFDLIRNVSSAPVNDLQTMLNAVIFNFIIGNHDAHGKNFSILHDNLVLVPEKKLRGENSEIRLAPLYDLVCTALYPDLSKKMAMKIGREYKSTDVSLKDFDRMAEEIGFTKPLVKARVKELAQKVLVEIEKIDIDHPIAKEVADHSKDKCNALLRLFED
jgi:serine/threonine-protein kinase HipA